MRVNALIMLYYSQVDMEASMEATGAAIQVNIYCKVK